MRIVVRFAIKFDILKTVHSLWNSSCVLKSLVVTDFGAVRRNILHPRPREMWKARAYSASIGVIAFGPRAQS